RRSSQIRGRSRLATPPRPGAGKASIRARRARPEDKEGSRPGTAPARSQPTEGVERQERPRRALFPSHPPPEKEGRLPPPPTPPRRTVKHQDHGVGCRLTCEAGLPSRTRREAGWPTTRWPPISSQRTMRRVNWQRGDERGSLRARVACLAAPTASGQTV